MRINCNGKIFNLKLDYQDMLTIFPLIMNIKNLMNYDLNGFSFKFSI